MAGRKVFIGWSGENKLIAEKVSVLLSQSGFKPIVGGDADPTSMFVGSTILEQMDKSEYAILLFERLPERLGGGVSANVMFEWGYLLHKLPDHNHIRVFLLNMNSSELPSDVSNCWSQRVEKPAWKTEEEKDVLFNDIATEICNSFIHYAKNAQYTRDKLDYFDDWENYKRDILDYDGTVRISQKLLYGMQASIYSGSFYQLHDALDRILERNKDLDPELKQVINCARAILDIFVDTKRLTIPLSEDHFITCLDALELPYESKIQDPDLAAWCRIFRTDKQELCIEYYAYSLEGEDRLDGLLLALQKCEEVLSLIDQQVAANPADERYAMLYRAFATRNLHLIYKSLYALDPKEEYLQLHKDYCKQSLEYRHTLFEHYSMERSTASITMDYVTQEYILSLAEQYHYEPSVLEQKRMKRRIVTVYNQWKEQNDIRNMIFNRISQEASDFLLK